MDAPDRARTLELVMTIAASTTVASSCAKPAPEPAAVIVPAQPAQPVYSAPPADPPKPTVPEPVPIATEPTRPVGRPAIATYAGPLPRACASIKCSMPPPWQESYQLLKSNCRAYERHLKKDEFERFLGCILAHNGTRETCDLTLVNEEPGGCFEGWAEPPQLDPGTEVKCKPIVAACSKKFDPKHSQAKVPLTMNVCQGLLSVSSPAGERKMLSCITEYCEDGPRLCYLAIDR